ncbi:hypothetical protein SAMN05216241_1162 [Limimonas halophila]|uniref:Single Cache domain 2-containing protein n=1 Tax=Limimonas halophila TaxID=1082479 RepID=A0A1G7UQ02_9PROT|nr:hypothetical protein [Limimonas halophila]SDG49593.1 hypothetical protein SAMN05216241_1162 [Limimonas halophila]
MKRIHKTAVAIGVGVALGSAPLTAQALEPKDLVDVRDHALEVLANNDLQAAIDKLGRPDSKALDLEGPGLHTWAFKNQGVILWDHSGQAQEGMDISDLQGMSGLKVIADVKEHVKNGDDLVKWADELPHPETGQVETSYVSCDTFAPKKYVCAMAWVEK